MSVNILQYESKVWATADLLIGAGIKQSDFPKYMMPYFALIMVESRLIRYANELEKELGRDDIVSFIEEFKDFGIGYNDFVVRQNKTLKTICSNDKTFDVDFHAYLKAFDAETKYLLGVDKGTEEEKFLDISGISGQLNKKKILFDTVKAWSEIDLIPFNNSEITTLEEHIKRKWADISAETAGEQYTPDDIIALISEIITSKIEDDGKFLTIYDPTCGGGNLLFGVEDKIKEKLDRPTKTYGEDWSDSLYALAKIESRFRTDSDIRYGNTLTNISFIEKKFDIIVANPPYGIPWKGFESDIRNDKTERFVALPNIGDGQLLFDQHIIYHLDNDGIAVVVNNGSALFSGEAGGGESNIRKYFFDEDLVEAVIQMPTNEFFNTPIFTYLWVFNKRKKPEQKNKVMLINASDHYVPLKKSKGEKRKFMAYENRKDIVNSLKEFKDNSFSKIFDKWELYYNRQAIMLTNVDIDGVSFESFLPLKENKFGEIVRAKSEKLTPIKVEYYLDGETTEINEFKIFEFDRSQYNSLNSYYEEVCKRVEKLDYLEGELRIKTASASYWYDLASDSLVKGEGDTETRMGCGKISIKASYKKATAKQKESIEISIELAPDYQKDFEIIPFSPIEEVNQKRINNFLSKYIRKPFKPLENTIGIEVNFNRIFYKPEQLPEVRDVKDQLRQLQLELSDLEKELKL